MESLLQGLPDAYLLLDGRNRIRCANEAAAALFLDSSNALAGRSLRDLFPRCPSLDSRDAASPSGTEASDSARSASFSLRGLRLNGREFPAEIRYRALNIRGEAFFLVSVRDETRNQKLEQAVRVRERRFRALIERSKDAFLLLDADGVIAYISSSVRRVLGYDPKECIGMSAFDLLHPDDRETYKRLMNEFVRSPGKSFRVELRARHRNGSWRWIETVGSNLLRDPGVQAIIANFRNVTLRKRHETEIRENRDLFKGVFDRASVGIALIGLDGRFLLANRVLAGMFGYAPPEMQKLSFEALAPEEESEPDLLQLYRLASGEDQSLNVTKRYRRKDGSPIWVKLSASLVRNAGGDPDYLISIIEDITRQRETEQEMNRSRERFRIAAESASDFVYEVDLESRVVHYYIEHAPADSAAGLPQTADLWRDSLHPEDREKVAAAIDRCLETGATLREDYRLRTADGSYIYCLDRAQVLFDENGHPCRLIGAITDQTEKKRLESQLLQSQKMDAVGRLAGGVAHDFNNMLSVILGYSDVLLNRPNLSEADARPLRGIRKATERAAELTRQLLIFSRNQSVDLKRIDLNQVVSETHQMLRRLIGEDIELTVVPAESPLPVVANEGQLAQIVLNLALNARDAMPTGGRLTVELQRTVLDDHYARMRPAVQSGMYARLTVSDTGQGMDSETLSHIFEPFFSTKEKGKGTGLGLSIVYGLVQGSQGHIEVYSEIGKGTVFKIYFPLKEEGAEEKAAPPPVSLPSGTGTILLVEDETGIREMLVDVLKESGYVVLKAAQGEEGLRLSETWDGPIHLLLTDVVMPVMGGRDLAERIMQTRPETKVLFMSGYTDDAVIRHGVLSSESAFIQKPFSIVALLEKVKSAIESG
jgi:PAS domain S-box-containing protein